MTAHAHSRSAPGGPLADAVFRSLWVATLVSNVGAWMEDVGENWLMTSLAGSPLMVALVQASASLPVFLVALPAGTLADIVDRRRLLLATQTWLFVVAATLGVLTLTHHVRPWGLLACTFAMGFGAAWAGPAWEAMVADLVPRSEIGRATTLNGVAMNLGRLAGPALGGVVVARVGPGGTFLLNALTFLAVVFALLRWRRPYRAAVLPAERLWTGMRTGVRYLREAVALRAVLARSAAVLAFASALWALLPSFVSGSLHGSPLGYGLLLGALGCGALAAASPVARVSARLGVDAVLIPATLLLAAGVAALAFAPSLALAVPATFVAGAAWLAILTTSMAAAQKSSAEWVRARALAVFLLVTEGATAAGSVFWGVFATRTSVRHALEVAAAGIAASVLVALARPLRELETVDRSPAGIYPLPPAPPELDPEATPVVVEIEYRVAAAQRAAFRAAMEKVGRSRRRTGAAFWTLTEDSDDPSRFVELFFIESWNEHLRQHGRWTKHDESVWRHARSLVEPATEPKVAHLVSSGPRRRR